MKTFHLHLVSDSTGETVLSVARACLAQFEEIEPVQHLWRLVRTSGQAGRVVQGIERDKGVVLFSIVDGEIREQLEAACRRFGVPCVSVLDPAMMALAQHLQSEARGRPGRQYVMNAEYYRRIDALDWTLDHDDGQMLDTIDEADVILVGVSRTSKTPTCIYLANQGLRVANYPLVKERPLPEAVAKADVPLIIGLTRDPRSLSEIRVNRLRQIGAVRHPGYAQYDVVREEVLEARRLFTRYGWPVIDVTRRSIEETAALILQLYADRLDRRQHDHVEAAS